MPGELLSREEIFNGDRISLRRDRLRFGSNETTREIVVHPGAAAAVPIVDGGDVLLVKQYRHSVRSTLFEIPAGTLEEGESAEECIRRELVEEVGFRANSLEHLLTIAPSPGVMTERISIYLARGTEVGGQSLDLGEELSVARMSMDQALQLVSAGELVDAKSFIGLVAAARHMAKENSQEEAR